MGGGGGGGAVGKALVKQQVYPSLNWSPHLSGYQLNTS